MTLETEFVDSPTEQHRAMRSVWLMTVEAETVGHRHVGSFGGYLIQIMAVLAQFFIGGDQPQRLGIVSRIVTGFAVAVHYWRVNRTSQKFFVFG